MCRPSRIELECGSNICHKLLRLPAECHRAHGRHRANSGKRIATNAEPLGPHGCHGPSRRPGELSRGGRDGRGVAVDDQPTRAVLDVGEAVARGQALGLAFLDMGERIAAGIDRRTAVHADQLIANSNLEAGQHFKRRNKTVSCAAPSERTFGDSVPQSTASSE
jgi:hypothetical protein